MFCDGGYEDYSGGREIGSKRKRIIGQGSSYYGAAPGASFKYNPPQYAEFKGQPPPFPVVKLCGLPFDCTESEISEFIYDLDIVEILFVLGYPLQIDLVLQRNRHKIGRRYVEVFRSKSHEYYRAIANEVSDSHVGS